MEIIMGKNWKLKYASWLGYWYEDETGKCSDRFDLAWRYNNGFGLVQLKNERMAYRDVNGKLSEEYEDAGSYSNGFGLVKLQNGRWAYRDVNGNLSKEEYREAESYSDGFGLVWLINGKCAYRDVDGNLSKEYMWAEPYINGFGKVELERGKYVYRDVNGNLSEKFRYIYPYEDGFGLVQLENEEYAYRDIDGNLFNLSEHKKIKRFWNGEVDVYDLEDGVFASDKLLALTIKKVKDNAHRFIKLTQTDEQLESVRRNYQKAMEYVLTKAYDIRLTNEQKEK